MSVKESHECIWNCGGGDIVVLFFGLAMLGLVSRSTYPCGGGSYKDSER
jgi:hypothetical protein